MTLRCLGIGWPLAKRLSPTVGQNCMYNSIAKDIRDTGNLNVFQNRIFKFLFNSWIVFFIIEMLIVFKINVLLLSLLFIEIRYFIIEM